MRLNKCIASQIIFVINCKFLCLHGLTFILVHEIYSIFPLCRLINKYFYRSIDAIEDVEAASQMSFAALLSGTGFGNSGVHMCHAISYALSGSVREYCPPGYSRDHSIIPHGLSVVMTAPAVFNEIGHVAPDRCIHLAKLLGEFY